MKSCNQRRQRKKKNKKRTVPKIDDKTKKSKQSLQCDIRKKKEDKKIIGYTNLLLNKNLKIDLL